MGKEQKLEWGSVYSEYVDWLETQLTQFCESHDSSPEEIFAELKRCMKSDDSDFMPIFMQNTEYRVFLDQMRLYANARRTRKIALAAAEEDSFDLNFSGHWVVDTTFNHKASAEDYMEATNCPWIFRKIFLHAATSKYLNVYIDQDGDESIRFSYRFKFFGGIDIRVFFGKEVESKNMFKASTKAVVRLLKDRRQLMVDVTKSPAHHPKGSKTWSTWEFDGKDMDALIYKKYLKLANGKQYLHEQHFVRVKGAKGGK